MRCRAAGGARRERAGTGAAATEAGGIVIVPTLEKPASARKLDEKDFGGYVMVYFKDQTHCAYMAVSRDGYTFTDLNGGRPIFDGTKLAEQKGVRDPHMARGPDGGFYLTMTDLHISGQRAGFRDTQWQRPQEQYGWGNNRALVLMKSFDLIHWTASDFRVDTAFPELGDIDCSWAPQTVYDDDEGQDDGLLHHPLQQQGMPISTAPTPTTTSRSWKPSPTMIPDIGGLDGDITKVGDKFHLHYVSNAQVLHAVSDKINEGYQAETEAHRSRAVPPKRPTCSNASGPTPTC